MNDITISEPVHLELECAITTLTTESNGDVHLTGSTISSFRTLITQAAEMINGGPPLSKMFSYAIRNDPVIAPNHYRFSQQKWYIIPPGQISERRLSRSTPKLEDTDSICSLAIGIDPRTTHSFLPSTSLHRAGSASLL